MHGETNLLSVLERFSNYDPIDLSNFSFFSDGLNSTGILLIIFLKKFVDVLVEKEIVLPIVFSIVLVQNLEDLKGCCAKMILVKENLKLCFETSSRLMVQS